MRSTRRVHLMLAAGMATLALTALPVGFDNASLSLDLAQAWADNGNGHGHANGHADAHGQSDSHGSVASSLGALNAAHASDTALAHASPNSRVGRIAAYRDAALAAQDAAAAAAGADQAVTDAQTAYDAAFAAADTNLDGVVDANDTPTPEQQDALTAAETALADAQAAAATVDQAATDAQAAADTALADAANKPVTDQVVDAVNDLLGIN